MTRMKLFYISKDGTCFRTVEFNGDGYCTRSDDNGWIGLQHLIRWNFDKNNLEESFKEMMYKFNEKTYNYPTDELDYFFTDKCSNITLRETIKNSYTDYIYIRNDGPEMKTDIGNIKTGITVFYFDKIITDEYIEQCIEEC